MKINKIEEYKKGYAICWGEWFLNKNLKNELPLLMLISCLCNRNGKCYASNEFLASMFEEDECTVSRKIKKLEKHNCIKIEYEKRGCEIIRRFITTIKPKDSRFTKKSIDDLQKNQSTIDEKRKENNISINNISNICDEQKIKKELLEEEFEKFWKLYPNKVSKGKARESLAKALTKTTIDTILKGVESYIKYIEIKNKQNYIKNPTTWLNQECWEDEYDFECNQKNDSSSPSSSAKPQDNYVHYEEITHDTDNIFEEKGITEKEFWDKVEQWKISVYEKTGEFINGDPPAEIALKILNKEI